MDQEVTQVQFFTIEWSVGAGKVRKELFDDRAAYTARKAAIAASASELQLDMSMTMREYTATEVDSSGMGSVAAPAVKKTRKPRAVKVDDAA